MEDIGFETITIPKRTYAVFETSKEKDVIENYFDILGLRTKLITEWSAEKEWQFAEAQELSVYHWMLGEERVVQIWMPVEVTDK